MTDEFDWLRTGLDQIAVQATAPDLTAAARRTSRRLATRRALASSVGVILAVIGIGGVSWRLASSYAAPVPVPAATPTPRAGITGTAYFMSREQGAGAVVVKALHGSQSRVVLTLPSDTGPCTYNSAQVSPDGTWISWVKTTRTGEVIAGNLTISRLDGTQQRVLRSDVTCYGDGWSRWTADSRGILVQSTRGDGFGFIVDVTTGAESPLRHGFSGWSADGSHFYGMTGWTEYTVMDANGTVLRTVLYVPPGGLVDKLQWLPRGMSSDGRLLALMPNSKEPGRAFRTPFVVDTQTGEDAALPGTGELGPVLFLVDGRGLLQRIDGDEVRLWLISATGAPLADVDQPEGLGELFAYVP